MKIIDAHLHLFPQDSETEKMAQKVGHHNSTIHLRQAYETVGIVHGVVMSNHSLDPDYHQYPPDLFHYCLYPGYNRIWLSDPIYEPIYQLATRYDKPVAVHMGLIAFPQAHLKYSHPLALDEVAADHPKTRKRALSCTTSGIPSWNPPLLWWRKIPM